MLVYAWLATGWEGKLYKSCKQQQQANHMLLQGEKRRLWLADSNSKLSATFLAGTGGVPGQLAGTSSTCCLAKPGSAYGRPLAGVTVHHASFHVTPSHVSTSLQAHRHAAVCLHRVSHAASMPQVQFASTSAQDASNDCVVMRVCTGGLHLEPIIIC